MINLFLTRDFLLSKLVVGYIVGVVLYVLAHYHIVVPDSVRSEITNQVIEVGGIVWLVVTKILDQYKLAKRS